MPAVERDNLEGLPGTGELIAGKYSVERVLGSGGMGVVLAARHIHLGQRVAVKFLRPDAAKQKESVGRFLREARAAVALTGQHVVRIYDVGTLDSGVPYMVMEHLDGRDLGEIVVQDGPMPIHDAIDYLLQGAEAIAEAHLVGIVHRDLKPSNLFLTRRPDGSPHVKVLDFGISKALDPAQGMLDASLTATTSVMGSPLYMSPEQVRSAKNVDHRTDVWALGVILYELLTACTPFEAESMTGLCAKIVADPAIPMRERRRDIPVVLDAVVMRALEKDVAKRYQSVTELAAALRQFASPEGQLSADRIARIALPNIRQQLNTSPPPAAQANVTAPRAAARARGEAAPPATEAKTQAQGSQHVLAETAQAWNTSPRAKLRRTATVAIVASIAGAAIAVTVVVAATRGPKTQPQITAAPPGPVVTTAVVASAPPPPVSAQGPAADTQPSATVSATPATSASIAKSKPTLTQPGTAPPKPSGKATTTTTQPPPPDTAKPPPPPPPPPPGDPLDSRR